jgi:hypothetical protein
VRARGKISRRIERHSMSKNINQLLIVCISLNGAMRLTAERGGNYFPANLNFIYEIL